jgi:hypothetical protein
MSWTYISGRMGLEASARAIWKTEQGEDNIKRELREIVRLAAGPDLLRIMSCGRFCCPKYSAFWFCYLRPSYILSSI